MEPRGLGAAVLLLLGLAPAVMSDYWTDQLARWLLFGLLAISLAFVWGRAGILCFGQAMFFGGGAYLMGAATLGLLGPALQSAAAGLALAVLGAVGFALLLGYFLFWGRGLIGPYLAVVTLAIAWILEQGARSWYAIGGDNGLFGVPPLPIVDGPLGRFYLALAVVALVWFGLARLAASPFGVLLLAVRTNPERLAFLGGDALKLKLAAFAIGAAIAGLAGALYAAYDEFASPTLIGFGLSTEALIWVALGGREMALAALLSTLLVRALEVWLSGALGDWWPLALGLVFMASVVLLPGGLIATPLSRLFRRPSA
jgi:urea transport system permease protein